MDTNVLDKKKSHLKNMSQWASNHTQKQTGKSAYVGYSV